MADSRARPNAAGLRGARLAGALLCGIALIVGIAWALATGPLNGPDESAHVAYVQRLAETGRGPYSNRGNGPYSTQVGRLLSEGSFSAIVGHSEGKPAWSALGPLDRELGRLPRSSRSDGDGPNPSATNPPLYYAYEAIAYRISPSSEPLNRAFVLRLANVALFVLTVLLTWLLAGELFAALWPRVLMTGLVALQPKLGFMAGVVNSDTLLVTVSTAFLLAAVRLVRRGPSLGRVVVVGVAAAAGPMTHGRGLFLLPAALVALAIGLWPLRREGRRWLALAAAAAVAMATGVAVAFLWTRSHTGGSAFGGEVTAAAPGGSNSGRSAREFLSYLWQFYFDPLSFMQPPVGGAYGYRQVYIETFFGTFGSLEVGFAPWVYDALQVAAALGLAALGAALLLHWDAVRRNGRIVAIALATFLSMIALLHVAAYTNLAQGSKDPIITGRYLLPCVALYAFAVTWTVCALARRAAPWIASALLAASVLLTMSGVALTAWRFGA